MIRGSIISVLLHAMALFGGLFLVSGRLEPITESRIIAADIVSVSDVTNIRAAIKASEPEDIIEPEAPMQLETPLDAAPEIGDPEVSAAPPDTPEPVQQAELALPDPMTDVIPETKPAKTEPEAPVFDLDAMSALVDRARDTQAERDQQKTLQSEVNRYEFAKAARAASGEGTDLTVSEIDALQSRMYQCWRISADAKNPEELHVRVRVKLHPDGQVISAQLMDRARITNSSNPYLRIAAERAVRAVSKCAPYDFLPFEKYAVWKDLELNFRPEL